MESNLIIIDESLKRPNYFTGKMLTTEDFTAEQEYFLAKLHRHNRYLHGWGVVHGLDVFIRDEMVVVTKGYAIDCAGNDILLGSKIETRLPLRKKEIYVVIEYLEKPISPIPSPFTVIETRRW